MVSTCTRLFCIPLIYFLINVVFVILILFAFSGENNPLLWLNLHFSAMIIACLKNEFKVTILNFFLLVSTIW